MTALLAYHGIIGGLVIIIIGLHIPKALSS
jgi:hypothetical protein